LLLQNSEIYRPYIKPPPNKTVCCPPDWEDSKHNTTNCTRGANVVNSQSVPKSSSSGHNSVWSSLSWSRSNKSPPSSSHTRHRNQQHQRHLNPSGSRHSSSSSSLSSTSSSGSKHKSFLGPLAVCSSLIDSSHSIGSSVQQRLQPVSSKEASSPSIAERLFGIPSTSTEKVTLNSQFSGEKTVGIGVNAARTSQHNSNNNISLSSSGGVLSKLFDDPVSSSSSSKIRKGKKSGRMSLEPSQGDNCFPAALSQPSPTRVLASVVVKETSGAIVGESCKAVNQYTAYHYPSSTSCDHSVLISSSGDCPGVRGGENTSCPDSSTESREVGCGREINCQNNDNNGNSRTRVLSADIGRHCDTTRLGEGESDSNRIREETQAGDGGNNRSKNLHSTTDSSLYHLTHPGFIDSALLSESEETAHQSELSDNSTPIQLSKQYCSTAEIASTSSICSSGQTKDVRSPRDVT